MHPDGALRPRFLRIQKCPEIVTKIKFLVDEGSFKYVMSGSLLGVELKGIASAPVWRAIAVSATFTEVKVCEEGKPPDTQAMFT